MIPFKNELEALHLPFGHYALFGSAVLAARNIRDAKDVDIVVKKELWESLLKKYPGNYHGTPPSLKFGNIEVFKDWRSLTAEIDDMVHTAEIFDGIPVVRPEYLVRFKKELGREKDFLDIELLTLYLTSKEC